MEKMEGGQRTPRTASSRLSRTHIHMNSQRRRQHAQGLLGSQGWEVKWS